jgi:acetoacetyl-CoA synthetase
MDLDSELNIGQDVLWQPSANVVAASAMDAFRREVGDQFAVPVDDYEALWQWSVDHPDAFWRLLWKYFEVQGAGSLERVLPLVDPMSAVPMSGKGWFPDVRLNYAQQVFAQRSDQRPAMVLCAEGVDPQEMSWQELATAVASLAQQLRAWGVRPGDRVAGFLPNIASAAVGLLASASLGAIWTCCPPDYGTSAVVDRFRQIEPVVLIAVDGYQFGGKFVDRRSELAEIAGGLPSVRHMVVVNHPDVSEPFASVTPAVRWEDLLDDTAELTFESVDFDHPLWILYSSGTTGLPKGIVHGHGGAMLEHLKWLGLHNDVRAGDRFFWYTSTAWTLWNVVISSLLLGAVPVLYDGSPVFPGLDAMWALVGRTASAYFGTSAGYIVASAKGDVEPRKHDLSSLRCVMSTGAPLPALQWLWIYDKLGDEIWLDSPSGGTDVCSAYVGASVLKPLIAGEIQARLLGANVHAFDFNGRPVVGEVGDLVVLTPMPSMPLYFWGDAEGERYRDAYFDTFPGVWRHGDWITVTERGGVLVHGRSDATINRHGVRMGSADIYSAVEKLAEVREALVIGAEMPDGGYYMPLFVALGEGELDDDLRQRIANQIEQECSRRHLPDAIFEVPAIPHTLTGKRLEVPVKRILQGVPVNKAVNVGVVDDPSLLDFYVRLAEHRTAEALRTRHVAVPGGHNP